MNYKKIIIFSCLIIGTLVSCNNNSEHQNEHSSDSNQASDSIVPVIDSLLDTDELSYTLPSPLQIAYVFKKSGAPFIPSLLNDNQRIIQYNTSNYKRAVNFGIYSADLAYCIFNKKNQESKKYLKACQDMGTYLGLNQAFEKDDIAKRFDKYISNEDSLVKLVSNVQLKTDILLEQNKQKHITAIAFSGAWIESMYLAIEIYKKEKNNKVLASLLEQLSLSEVIVKALKKHEASEHEISELIKAIEKINGQFNSIASVKNIVEKEQEMDIDKMPLTDTEFKVIDETILSIRRNMTN